MQMMSKKITYMLGAGASANALPLIKNSSDKLKPGLPQELKTFVELGQTAIRHFNSWEDKDYFRLVSIAEKCIEFGTPDLCAKTLWETGDTPNYILLKRLIS